MFSLRLSLALGVLLLGLVGVQEAYAKTFVVTSTVDADGSACGTDCTLRQALNAANQDRTDSDVITFNEKVFASKQTIFLYGVLPSISDDISIVGPNTPGSGVTLWGNGETLFSIRTAPNGQAKLRVDNLTLTGTNTGIDNWGGYVTASNCTFSNNNNRQLS